MVAQVWINHCPIHIDKAYDYAVLPSMVEQLQIGMRVIVPFGKGNKKQEGIVCELTNESVQHDGKLLKPILALLDEQPILTKEMLSLARFMKERFFCTYYDGLRLMLPPRSSVQFFSHVTINPKLTKQELEGKCLTTKQRDIFFFIWENNKKIEIKQLEQKFPRSKASIQKLIIQNVLLEDSHYSVAIKKNYQKRYVLAHSLEEAENILSRQRKDCAARYRKVIDLLVQNQAMGVKELHDAGVSAAVLKTLQKKGLIQEVLEPVTTVFDTWVMQSTNQVSNEPIILSKEQEKVYHALKGLLNGSIAGCALLKGVTGSGKTHIYLKLIEDVIAQDKQAIVLVPEIALTPQMVGRFTARFQDRVGVLHSAMSLRERYDMWHRIQRGEITILIGTRMAIFAPMPRIGIIILDEEQESSYKSEITPHYHTRDVAKFRCVAHGGLLLLASATPSIDSYYNAQIGKYSFYELKERYNQGQLPIVKIVDMAKELREGNSSLFSNELKQALIHCFEKKQQAVLLLNRRGYSSFATCRECGYIPKCTSCSVSLTYHAHSDSFMCHYCGYTMSNLDTCPQCHSTYLKYVGFGTQRVEEELKALLPSVKIMRMDADTTKGRQTHSHILQEFGEGKADILLGTQMVAKGLDFHNVTFVGVLSADLSLYLDDYRSNENTFSMLTQVVGRAGRGYAPGTAVIQTLSPNHEVIGLAAKQDYEGFYNSEIGLRRQMGYPPFFDLCVITLSGTFESHVRQAIQTIAQDLRAAFKRHKQYIEANLLGPAPAPVARINNKYRYRVAIKCRNDKNFRLLLNHFICHFYSQRGNKNYVLTVDINPYSML